MKSKRNRIGYRSGDFKNIFGQVRQGSPFNFGSGLADSQLRNIDRELTSSSNVLFKLGSYADKSINNKSMNSTALIIGSQPEKSDYQPYRFQEQIDYYNARISKI